MTEQRIYITEKFNLSDYTQCKIEDLIVKLQELSRRDGYTYFNAELDTYPNFGGDFVRLEATYKRLETDAEYDARVAQLDRAKERRRALYEQLRSEFDEVAGC